MSLLLLMPDDILISILSEMCPVKNVLKLDTVYCNGHNRIQLLRLFKHKNFALSDISYNENVQSWIYKKNIKFKAWRHSELNIDFSQVDTSLVEQLIYFPHYIIDDKHPCRHSNVLVSMVNQCPRLKQLTYEGYDSIFTVKSDRTSDNVKLDEKILSNLTSIEFNHNNEQMITWFFAQFAMHCFQLNKINFFTAPSNIGPHLETLVRNNKELKTLTVYTTSENPHHFNPNNLIHSFNSCSLSRLIKVCLDGRQENLDFTTIFELIIKCQHTLEEVAIKSINNEGEIAEHIHYTCYANIKYLLIERDNSLSSLIGTNHQLEHLFTQVHDFNELHLFNCMSSTQCVIDALARNSSYALTKFVALYTSEEQANAAQEYIVTENKFQKLVGMPHYVSLKC